MHIEPGMLAQHKIRGANIAVVVLLLAAAPAWLTRPTLWLRTALAAVFFTLFMQAFHRKVGPSELYFVGAMSICLLLGFLPTLFGFAIGLLLQGLLFEPQDLVHLAVNTWAFSLVLPMAVVTVLIVRDVRSVRDARCTRVCFDERLTAGARNGIDR